MGIARAGVEEREAGMKFGRLRVLRGPNLWARVPVIEVEPGAVVARPADLGARLAGWLSPLAADCLDGPLQALQRAPTPAHALQAVALELQRLAGCEVTFGATREGPAPGLWRVAVEYEEEPLGRACLEAARGLCQAAQWGEPFDLPAEVRKLRDLAHEVRLGPCTAAIVRAARRCGIPVYRLDDARLVQFGQGARARRICAAEPDRTGALEELFPAGQTGRIPLVAVTGVNGKTTVVRLVAHLLTRLDRRVGMTCTEGIYIQGRRVEAGDCSGPQSARTVLQNPVVEAAVLKTARGGILREGLGFDRCDVAVVTNIAEGDPLGISGVETVEDLARVKRIVVEAVAPEGSAVLKADDPLVAAMAGHCPGSVIFFTRRSGDPVLAAHRAAGGRAVFAPDGRIVLAQGAQEMPLVLLRRVPFTLGGRIGFQVENALAAAGAAWALGLPHEAIRAGLESFVADLDGAPARFNVVELDGATVILDYGHNPSSLACIIEALDNFPHRRRTAVYGAAGDRRDGDVVRQGELLGRAFDRAILFEEESCMRGRQPSVLFALLRQGLAAGGRVREVEEVAGAVAAAEAALGSVQRGDLALVQVDQVDETLDLVRRRLAEPEPPQAVDFDTTAAQTEEPVAAGV
jgi:cyanophycin synthetase